MEDDTRNIAVHEAGHAFVHALLSIPFTYVTIIPDQNVNHYGDTALGYLMPNWSFCGKESSSNPWRDPNDFTICFMEDLGIIAGMVAEMLYRKDEMNFTGSKSDLKQLNHNCRNKLPASIRNKYSSFLIAYALSIY
jgi:ATP-dependent Zn protease